MSKQCKNKSKKRGEGRGLLTFSLAPSVACDVASVTCDPSRIVAVSHHSRKGVDTYLLLLEGAPHWLEIEAESYETAEAVLGRRHKRAQR